MMRLASIVLSSAIVLPASCAPLPRVDVGQSGGFPVSAPYRLEYGEAALPPELATGIVEALQARGFRRAEPPRYLVQLAGADRPGRTGLFLPGVPPDESGTRSWLSSPARSKSVRTRRLIVSITDITNGQEVYRIQASELYRPRRSDGGKNLARAVLAQLPAQ